MYEKVKLQNYVMTYIWRGIYLLHLRAPGQLWIKFWIVGCEKPKNSAPDGTMGVADLELKYEDTGE